MLTNNVNVTEKLVATAEPQEPRNPPPTRFLQDSYKRTPKPVHAGTYVRLDTSFGDTTAVDTFLSQKSNDDF